MKRRNQKINLMLCGVFFSAHVAGEDWQSFWQRPDQQAHQKLMDGDPAAAAGLFDDPNWRGISHYRAEDYEAAEKEFAAIESESALYNHAVTAVRKGEYEDAVEKFESLLENAPEHADAKHNLDIARELAKQKKQQEQQQQSDQSQQQDQQQDDGEQQSQDGEQQSQDGQQDDSQKSQGESDSENAESKDSGQQGGELATDAEQASKKQDQQSAEQSAQQQAEQEALEQQEAERQAQAEADQGEEGEEREGAAQAQASAPTEGEQATEQWLRRIPDDPSKLLRNKIKLNHMMEHADVRDMQEPW